MSILRKTIILILGIIVFLPQVLPARPVAVSFSERTRFNSAIRSAILPGWGQSFNEQETKGYVIAGIFFASGVATYVLSSKASKTYDDYEKLGIKNDSLYEDYVAQSNQAAMASYLTLGVWLYGIVDAYIFGTSSASSNEQFSKKEGLGIDPFSGDCRLSYTKRF